MRFGPLADRTALVLATVAASVLSLAVPIATLQIYDRILPNRSEETLVVLFVGVAAAIMLDVLLKLTRAHLIGFAGAAFVHKRSSDAMTHILNADLHVGARDGAPIDMHSLGAVRNLKDFHNGTSLVTATELAFVPLFLGLIAYVAGWLALAPAAVVTLFLATMALNGAALKQALQAREERDDARYNFLIESMRAIHAAKAFGQENYLLRRYEALQGKSSVANFGVSEAATASFNGGAFFSQAMLAATVGLGAIFVVEGSMTVGALIATTLLSGRILQPLQRALVLWARFQDYGVSRAKVNRIFEAPTISTAGVDEPPERSGSVRIENASFAYPGSARPLIAEADLSLQMGQSVAIVGAAGSGKSTLLRLIAGLHRPTSGAVFVDGVEATSIPPKRLSAHVGYLPASSDMFRGTIRDNLTRFGETPMEDVMLVARLLGADEEIAKLPAGMETKVESTDADSIPPGLKQRIGIVRVLAAKPRILLFDNADRALDVEGYRKVHALLARLRSKTAMAIVSEDQNLLALADRRFELNDGVLTETAQDRSVQSESRGKHRQVRL